jgi:chitin deacetylase
MLFSVLLASIPFLVSALYVPESHDGHDHVQRGALPKRWYHDESHPVHQLFRRATDDGNDYPAVGTPSTFAIAPLATDSLSLSIAVP